MKKLLHKAPLTTIFSLWSSFSLLAQINQNHAYINSDCQNNGLNVTSCCRIAPNSTNRDNFSIQVNANPYTNQSGWILPDNKPLIRFGGVNSLPFYSNWGDLPFTPAPLPLSAVYANANFDFESELKEIARKNRQREAVSTQTGGKAMVLEQFNQNEYDYAALSNQLMETENAINYHDRYGYEDKLLIQTILRRHGYTTGPIDGKIDEWTINGIKNFQRANHLKIDGRISPVTLKKITTY